MTRVAAIGEAMIELSWQKGAAQVGVAGDSLNTAIYLKRAAPGLQVDYITCLGDDPFSDQIEGFINEQGISTQHCERITGKTPGLYAITTSDTGERSFTYWRSASAARDLFQKKGQCEFSLLKNYDLLYLSGISVAILPQWVRLALLEWLTATPVRLAYDSNYRPRLWEDTATAQEITEAFWQRADICLPSVDDEIMLFGGDPKAVVARFDGYQATGALKRGEEGPVSLGSQVEQTYAPATQVVDTTAAGDSFNGAYLAAILSGRDQRAALQCGHACAARVVQYRGAIVPEGEME